VNSLIHALREGRSMVGSVLTVPDPFVAELMARAGFDYLIIDMQHAPLSLDTVQQMLIVVSTSQTPTLVRVPSNDFTWIGQVLDLGPDGIIVPLVNSAEELRSAMRAAKYPPDGQRSWGPRRAGRLDDGVEAYASNANADVLVIPQIETMEAAENLPHMLTEPGCEAVMIGPADLAWSMGQTFNRTDDDFDRRVHGVLETCRSRGVAFGHFTGSVEKSRYWTSVGAQLTTVGADFVFLMDGVNAALAALREVVAGRPPVLTLGR